jgi:hypothetical protein
MADPLDIPECVRQLTAQISDEEIFACGMRTDLPGLIRRANSDQQNMEYDKTELAISLLHADFCNGALTTFVRTAAGPVPLTSSDWREMVRWRDVILSGVILSARNDQAQLLPQWQTNHGRGGARS